MSKLLPLAALYFAQGLPFGFQASALPLLLRERGVSLQAIGFASLLSLPWLCKALWAPLVDRYGSRRFGRRKSWIVPLQAALAVCALLAANSEQMSSLTLLILLMNLCAATQDIAVDAWAVSTLAPGQLGPANAVQVVGYKLGMLTGGGLLVWASARIGWSGLFYAIAALMLLVMLVSVQLREEPAQATGAASEDGLSRIGARLLSILRERSSWALLAVVVTYKTGEALADAMWKPMLLDRGFSAAQIGLWSGTFGMLCSLFGSAAAGAAARRAALPMLLVSIAAVRALGVAGEWWVSRDVDIGSAGIIAVTCIEHLVGGAITTVMFALMMRHTDRQIGATHYTVLASLEVFGKLPAAALSGVVAATLGYEALFALATLLSLGFALLARALVRPLTVATSEAHVAGAVQRSP